MWFLLMVLAIVVYFIISSASRGGPKTSLSVLKSRYAKGEISKEEFERMKKESE